MSVKWFKGSSNQGSVPGKIKIPTTDDVLTIHDTVDVAVSYGDEVKLRKIVPDNMGDGSQDENQKPVFKLQQGAELQNIIISKPGCDGVHCKGANEVRNVWWEDVGEDALTVDASDSFAGKIEIIGGGAWNAKDKIFQINGPCEIHIIDFYADGFSKLVRVNGGSKFKVDIYIESLIARNGSVLIKSDSPYTNITIKNSDLIKVGKLTEIPKEAKIKKTDVRIW